MGKIQKPDVSMSLNGSLAGLVAITAGCDTVSPTSAAIIGIISGFVVVFGIEFIDKVLKVDDPVGAVGVHGLNGAFGTLAVGLFSDGTGTEWKGLLVGGGFHGFGVQFIGMIITIAWVAVTMTIIFQAIKHTVGLRVTAEEEIEGLDSKEHGLTSAYDGFVVHDTMTVPAPMGVAKKSVSSNTSANVAPAEVVDTIPDLPREGVHKLTKVVIITRQSKLEEFMHAMNEIGVTGITITNVMGCGVQKGARSYYRGVEMDMNLLPKIKIEIVVSLVPVKTVIDTAKKFFIPASMVTARYSYMISKMLLRSVPVKKDSKHFRTHSLLNDFSVKNILIPLLALKNSSSTEGLFFYVYDYISSLLFSSGKLWKIPSVMCRKVSDQYNYC